MEYKHTPVMLKEAIEYLNPQAGQNFIDCTLGGAGYTIEIAKMVGPRGKVLAIDLDKLAIENAEALIKENKLRNIILANDNFKNILQLVHRFYGNENSIEFDGIVFDLGLSSAQLEDGSRGFSFRADAPLNMAFGRTADDGRQTTEYIVNNWEKKDLEKIFREYGEERFAGAIARKIADCRKTEPIKTTGRLTEIIISAAPKRYLFGKIHPATRIFQALRIATNEELENLEQALPQAASLLKQGGRIAAVSFHSLEDRIVKQFFKAEARGCVCPPDFPVCCCGHQASLKIITKKALTPAADEIGANPRSRSAKLRVAEKI